MFGRQAARAALIVASITVAMPRAARGQADTTHRLPAVRDSLSAILIGRVVDSAGHPIAGAEIGLLNSDQLRTITNDSGAFRINGLPSGPVVIAARRLGYEPSTYTAILKPGRVSRANFPLPPARDVIKLQAMNTVDSASHWFDQFNARRATQKGAFITRKDIDRVGAHSAADVLRTVAGVRVGAMRNGQSAVIMNQGAGARACIPTVFIHNMQFSGTPDDIPIDDIAAMEVYVGIAELPPELTRGGRNVCGAIVIWTRDPKERPPRDSSAASQPDLQ